MLRLHSVIALVIVASWFANGVSAAENWSVSGNHHYLFVSNRRVVTVELITAQKAILNYINLGDAFEFLQAPMLMILDDRGDSYHGRVIEVDESDDPTERFEVSRLLGPNQFQGLSILGDYRFKSKPQVVFFQVGSLIIELQPLSAEEFEFAAAQIGELDLSLADKKRVLMAAGFRQGLGEIHRVGTPGARMLEGKFPSTDLLPPLLLASPMPLLPLSFANITGSITVLVGAMVNPAGFVHDLKIEQGINPKLNEMALDVINNSWSFLPAISKGKIATAELTLEVTFRRN